MCSNTRKSSIRYQNHNYQASAPIFEQALTKLKDDKDQTKWRRVATDQAGLAYGLAGNIPKARAIFEAAVGKDPDYPVYYYNARKPSMLVINTKSSRRSDFR